MTKISADNEAIIIFMLLPSLTAILILFMAVFLNIYPKTRPYALASWVLSSVLVAYLLPNLFQSWWGQPSRTYVPPLIQVAMFGMGATLTFQDFGRVLKMPRAVAVGMILQFTVMPLVGWGLATAFRLPTDLAVGVILIGCCPGGVASNVITYLAKGDVPLSVTMTACSTLAAPLLTPLWMQLLAGRIIEVPFMNMVWEILRIVIAPIAIGLLVNKILRSCRIDPSAMERWLSILSMVAICLICAIIVADARSALNQIGLWFLLIIATHNAFGYAAGYWGAKLIGLNESAARTIAIEVGMQNGGMGASLATNLLKNTTSALASALFGTWMTIAGSILAAYWRKTPTT
jgi:bile acid:Na+ symporter, BASS family